MMLTSNTPAHVFRFVQLRPATPLKDREHIELEETEIRKSLDRLDAKGRADFALDQIERDEELSDPAGHLQLAPDLAAKASEEGILVGDLRAFVDGIENGWDDAKKESRLLSDAYLTRAVTYPAAPPASDTAWIEPLVKLLLIIHNPDSFDASLSIDAAMSIPLTASLGSSASQAGAVEGSSGGEEEDEAEENHADSATKSEDDASTSLGTTATLSARLAGAVKELSTLQETGRINPANDEQNLPFALTAEAVAGLSDSTAKVLDALEIDSSAAPAYEVIHRVELSAPLAADLVGYKGVWGGKAYRGDLSLAKKATLKPAGVADLLVVKQQVTGYEATELAHVENVMPGETRTRDHRKLERTEEFLLTEEERTSERTNELTTSERFELNKEVSKTIKEDQKLGFNLSLSGKYGPTVEFTSNASLERASSEEESTKSASTFARDVMSRSLSKLIEREREVRSTLMIEETEESNLHSFVNETNSPIVGMYQFLDKVYANQIFNYGQRMMFDFMVPEPSSYLWYLEDNPTDLTDLPEPPTPLSSLVANASQVSAFNYAALAATYRASGIQPPPSAIKAVSSSYKFGEGGSESGRPRNTEIVQLSIPKGYRPRKLEGVINALTDNKVSFYVSIDDRTRFFRKQSGVDVENARVVNLTFQFDWAPPGSPLDDQSKLDIGILAYESRNYTITFQLVSDRDPSLYTSWQLSTFEALQNAYLDRLNDYNSQVTEILAEAEQEAAQARAAAPYGDSPAANRVIIDTELKKHSVTILSRQRYETFGSLQIGDPPWFPFNEAAAEGSFIKFFEQAFEWDQMQYVFYPYYWANGSSWSERFRYRHVDPVFQEFLQAGEARVVVPVRPGFERAVSYYLATGSIWGGSAEPPIIGDENYVSIVTEIEERTQKSKGEVPVGEMWESRLPTHLVILRSAKELPSWENQDAEGWEWQPVEA